MSSRSGEASCELLYTVYVYVYLSEQEMAETERERGDAAASVPDVFTPALARV